MKKNYPVIDVVFGGLFFVAGFCMFLNAYYFVSNATKTTGTIVNLESDDTSDGTTYHPVFVFTNAAGTEYRCRSSHGSFPCIFRPGDSVSVVYDAAVPTHAEINSIRTIWSFPFIFMGAGGFWIHRVTRKARREEENEVVKA
jgi:hypothetical protein